MANLGRHRKFSLFMLLLTSAVLQCAIFPIAGPVPPFRAALAWVALLPLLLALLKREEALSVRRGFLLGYLCGVLWYAGNCYWIYQTMYLYGGLPKPISLIILLLFALYLGLYHGIFGAFLVALGRSRFKRRGALLFSPFLWVAVELARSRITGFPWDLLGNSQIDNSSLTRIAPYAGVLAISFLLAAANAAFASGFLLKGRLRLWVPAGALILVAASYLSALPVWPRSGTAEAKDIAVLLQENLAVGTQSHIVHPMSQAEELSTYRRMSASPLWEGRWAGERQRMELAPESPGVTSPVTKAEDSPGARLLQKATIIVWPEAPSHFRSDDPNFRQSIGQMAQSLDTPAIIGALGVDFSDVSPRGYLLYDSAALFSAAGEYSGRYDKIHLVPWGEYIPFKEVFAFAHKLTEGAGDMDRGNSRTLFTASGHRYGVFVCYESIFGDEVREFAKAGAEVLVNISDDGWYGDTGAPWQHLNMTRMRAIENDRWVLLDTNTGITTSIDPHGHLVGEAPRHVRDAFAFPFAFRQRSTFYTEHGDWFAWICVGLTLLTLVLSFLLPSRRPSVGKAADVTR